MSFFLNKLKNINLAMYILIALALGIIAGALFYLFGVSSITEIYLRPIGAIFVNLLKFIVVPVVFLSIIDGVVSMGDFKKLGSVGLKSVSYFFLTSVLACLTGLLLSSFFSYVGLFQKLSFTDAGKWNETAAPGFKDIILGLFTGADMLTVIIVAIMVGAGIIASKESGKVAANVLNSFYSVFEKITHGIIRLSPLAVFAMISWVVATQGINIIGTLAIAILCAYIGYILHAIVVYSISAKFFGNISPIDFFRNSLPAIIFAFTSASSVATIPVSKECCDKMKVEPGISSFVIPLGATVNMNGTAIYQCVATIFLATCCNVHLTIGQMIFVVASVTASSIGTAGVPGSATITLAMVLSSVGIPIDAIMLIYGIDRIFDMGRTVINITGDISCALCVSRLNSKKVSNFKSKV